MKRSFIAIIIILALVLAGGYWYLKKRQMPEYDIIQLVSNEAAFFLDIHNTVEFLDNLRKDNSIWNELTHIEGVKKFEKKLFIVDSLIQADATIKDLLSRRRILMVAEKQGKSRMGLTFLAKMKNLREQNRVKHYLEKWAKQGNNQLNSRTYNKVRLFSIETPEKHKLSYAATKGILIASTSPLLVEQSLRQTSVENNLVNSKSFKRAAETAGKNVAANLYINFKNFPEILSLPLSNSYKSYINNLTGFASWAALDINLKSDALLLNGFTINDQGKNEIMDLFQSQNPVEMDISSVLPSNTAAYISLGISNKEDYLQQLMAIYQEKEVYSDYQDFINNIEKKFNLNPGETIYKLLNEEIGMVLLDSGTKDPMQKAFIIMRTRGKKYAQPQLIKISKKLTAQSGESSLAGKITIDEETQYPVYKLPIDNLFSNLFGDVFHDLSNRYYTFIDQYAVFSGSPELLKEFIYSNVLNKTLEHNRNYKKFSEYLSNRANFHFYSNMYHSPFLLSHFMREDLGKGIQQNKTHIRKFQALAFQLMNSGDMIYNNLFLKYIPELSEEPQTVWETHLDTSIHFKPALVTNHYTGENEIFVQDQNNKVYLINKVGRILWEKQLEEKIMSDVYQIDYYKNGKLQMLFNTKNKIHLIDRNGNYVERYPVRLPSPASAPLSVFDYENNKNYRIFVPCENKRVYDFSKEGDIIPGWQFDETDTQVDGRVQHFRVKTRDYIVFADEYQIYILNRRGQVRVKPEKQFARSPNNLFTLEPQNSRTQARLVTTDINGTIYYVYFNGEVKTSQIRTFSPDHHFLYQDMNGDGLKDLIFLEDNKLEVFENSNKKMFEYEFKTSIEGPPIYFHFSQKDRKLGLVSRDKNRIYLLNGNGKMHTGFPLQGSTRFSIGFLDESDNNFNLIVGNQFNFLYNYNVLNQ
jgi:hypothetical protein